MTAKIATRESYGKALQQLGRVHENIVVLDADLAGATKTSLFKSENEDRFFDCGIAEANMTNVAAGLSTMGLVPFISTFAMFASGRAYDMVRNTIGYPGLNVKICATHGGLSVGEDGASHQMNEDFALMRAIPGMTVLVPSDDVEARSMVQAVYEHKGPVYIRFSRAATEVFHDENYTFTIGKAEMVQDGEDLTIIAAGIMVPEAIKAAALLKEQGISAQVINMATLKPLDEAAIIAAARKTGCVLTVEEHSTIGGLGDAVISVLAQNCPVLARKVGVNDVFGKSGPAEDLLEDYGLCASNICAQALDLLAKSRMH